MRFPRAAKDQFGNVLRMYAEYISGSSGPMYLKYSYQGTGDASAPAYAYVVNSASARIQTNEDSFDLTAPPEGPARWVVTIVVSGESDPSDWWSTDNGATLTRAS